MVCARRLALAAALCAPLVAGCGGSGQTPSGVPCPQGIVGSSDVPASPQLLYPIDGARSVPDGNFSLVFAFYAKAEFHGASRRLQNSVSVVQASAYGTPPNPLPSPIATPRPNWNVYLGSSVPALLPNTTYSVTATTGTAPCSSQVTYGTFTTK
jgi:hypothetical protein